MDYPHKRSSECMEQVIDFLGRQVVKEILEGITDFPSFLEQIVDVSVPQEVPMPALQVTKEIDVNVDAPMPQLDGDSRVRDAMLGGARTSSRGGRQRQGPAGRSGGLAHPKVRVLVNVGVFLVFEIVLGLMDGWVGAGEGGREGRREGRRDLASSPPQAGQRSAATSCGGEPSLWVPAAVLSS